MTSTQITPIDPDQLIAAFNEQASALDQIVQTADANYDHAKEILTGLLQLPGQNVEGLELAWKKVNRARKALKGLVAVVEGGRAALEAVTEQRDTAVEELDELTEAIDNYDSGHSKLEDFATSLRDDGYTDGHDDAYDEAHTAYREQLQDAISEYDTDVEDQIVGDLSETWNFSRVDARKFLWALRGDDSMTDEQQEAFNAFLKLYKGETDE